MRKTKAQKEFHKQMKAIDQEDNSMVKPFKRRRKSFKDTKLFYYGIRILIIMSIIQIVGIIDTVFFGILDRW